MEKPADPAVTRASTPLPIRRDRKWTPTLPNLRSTLGLKGRPNTNMYGK